MRRRSYLAAVSAAALGVSGCSNLADDGGSAGNDGTPTDVIETLEPTDTAAGTGVTTETSASGTEATVGTTAGTNAREAVPLNALADPVTVTSDGGPRDELFELAEGPVTAAFSHEGESNFIVELVPAEGDLAGSVALVNTIGEVEGSQVVRAGAAGPYSLDVTAAGDWELTLNQPTDPEPEPLPIDAEGEGFGSLGPYAFDGATTFTGSHDGDGPFVVSPIAVGDASITTSIFNELGSFEDERTGTLPGPAYLNVRATGEWTLSTAE